VRLVKLNINFGNGNIMNIGKVSKVSGLPIKTIRYYEDMGLINPLRQENGYRVFDQETLSKLKLLRRSRDLGFSLKECAQLLTLFENPKRASKHVMNITKSHLFEIEKTISELQIIQGELKKLVGACAADEKSDCSILNDLSDLNTLH